jgi:hypothetical protein
MATTSIGVLYSTAIPGYADSADIQAALRAYHYGSYTYDPANTSTASLINPSIAYTLNDLQYQIDNIEVGSAIEETIFTAKGQILSASAASTPDVLSIGSNNQFLIANSATATGLQWTNTLSSPTISSPTITNPTITGLFLNDSSIVFEGSSADANETTLSVTNPTADRTVTIPDASGTIAFRELEFNSISATSYTFVAADNGKMVVAAATSGPATFSIPTNASVPFGVGTTINIIGTGTGLITISASSSGTTTVASAGNTPASPTLRAQYSSAMLIKASTDVWYVVGDIA